MGDRPQGVVKYTAGDYGLNRLDLWYGKVSFDVKPLDDKVYLSGIVRPLHADVSPAQPEHLYYGDSHSQQPDRAAAHHPDNGPRGNRLQVREPWTDLYATAFWTKYNNVGFTNNVFNVNTSTPPVPQQLYADTKTYGVELDGGVYPIDCST